MPLPQSPLPPACRIGVSGWSYANWNNLVYPRPKPRGFHPLAFLAGYIDVVEINASFHYPLRPEVTALWATRVEGFPNFRFTAKLGHEFTHERRLEPERIAAFKEGLYPLLRRGRLAALLMQFPWSFRFTTENREFLIRLRRTFHEFPLAAEFRHRSWLVDEALGTLIDYRVGFCNIDQPEYASAMPPTALVTSSVAYVRLHGRANPEHFRDFAATPERRPDYLYSPAELNDWRGRIEHLRKFAGETCVLFNNDTAGQAVVNALQMRSALEPVHSRLAPRGLIRRYRVALDGYRADRPVQEALFSEAA